MYHKITKKDVIEFVYHNKLRRGRIEHIRTKYCIIWIFGDGFKSFRYDKMSETKKVNN